MDFGRFKNKNDNVPLCKFGPGGEFQESWQPGTEIPVTSGSNNSIGKLLDIVAEMAGLTANVGPQNTQNTTSRQEKVDEKPKSNFKTDPGLASNKIPQQQQMLFPINKTAGTKPKHKQNNRVRTRRVASKKTNAKSLHRQGTLFDSHSFSYSAA